MQAVVRRSLFYDPFAELRGNLDAWGSSGFRPAEQVISQEERTLIRLDVPGVSEDKLAIESQEGVLTVKGTRDFSGTPVAFSRSWRLVDGVDTDKIEAHLQDGVLELRVPKPERAAAVKIEVKEVVPALEAAEETESE